MLKRILRFTLIRKKISEKSFRSRKEGVTKNVAADGLTYDSSFIKFIFTEFPDSHLSLNKTYVTGIR